MTIAGDVEMCASEMDWKSTAMPDEAALQKQLAAFQAELADVLDWEAASIRTTDALMYT